MGARGYDRHTLTAARAEGGNVLIEIDSKELELSPNDARKVALRLREAADRAELPGFNPAKAKGNE